MAQFKRAHTVSFDPSWHSMEAAEEEESAAVPPAPPSPPLRPRLSTDPSCYSPQQVELGGHQGRETQGERLWQSVQAEHRNLLEGETYHAHCSVSVAISNRSVAQHSRRRTFISPTSGYHKLEVVVTDYSLHFFKQRRAVVSGQGVALGVGLLSKDMAVRVVGVVL